MESVVWQVLELRQADFGHALEALAAVYVDGASGELVPRAIGPEMSVAGIDEAVAAAPAIRIDNGAWVGPTPNNPL